MLGNAQNKLKTHSQHDAAEGLQCLISEIIKNMPVSIIICAVASRYKLIWLRGKSNGFFTW